jgi:hypothetical protein
VRFVERRKRVRSIEPAAIGAAGNLARADKDRLLRQGKVRTPWQDRQTLLLPHHDDAQQLLAVLLMAFGARRKP